MAEVKSHKVKQLSSRLDPNAIYWVQASANLPIEGFITDINGVPYPLKDISGTGGITSITNTDGNIQIVGATGVVINLSTSLLSTISSALQSGDNISELVNDSNFITLSDLPTNTSELINDGANGTSTYVESNELGAVATSNSYNDLDDLPTIPLPITKTSDLINDGDDGVSPFISLEDLPSNLVFYPTSAASDILGYSKIVTSITDPSYDSVAVDINTGGITGSDQLIASLATSANIIVGNPGLLNITTIGNIKRISGSGTAEFYFEVYKRDSLGVETLITTSSNTSPIVSAIYSQFSATALWNDGVFSDTDRIVLKFYGTKVGGGSSPTYNFQFGGSNPVRTTVPVPLNVIPTVALDDLSDVTITAPSNGDILSYETTSGLWKNTTSISNPLGKIRIVDKLGEVFTDLATASAYVSSFTLATLTNESFSDGVFYFTVPNGSSFAELDGFLAPDINNTVYIEDTLGLINNFGNDAFYYNIGNNILGNCTFGTSAFYRSAGSNIFGDCTFGEDSFQISSSNNTFGNCTFDNFCFINATGINKFKNILLTSPANIFAGGATGRFEIYGNIGTTEAANYTNFFATSNATIWADKSKETSNGGALEGDLATAQTNGSKLFFGYVPELNAAFTDIVDLGGVTGAVSIDWSLGVKHKLNLTGSVTITQTNYAAFEGQKVQEIQITSSDPSYTITWVDVDPLDFTDAIDFATSTTYNNVSVRLLRSNIFQSNNFVR